MKRNVLLGIGLLTVLVIVFVNAKNFAEEAVEGGYEVGSIVTDFELKNVDGKMVSMASYDDAKGYIVIFTCNTCPYSKMYEQRIDDLNQQFAKKGFPVLAINSNDKNRSPGDSFDLMVKRSKDKNYSFPYLYDESQKVAARFGATRTPHVFVVDRQDKDLKVAYIGAIDNNAKDRKSADKKYVEDAVNALIDGKSVNNNFTKAIGCGIKWKEA